ncbi:hypothetical protein GGTG_00280 [Gaeumannomyces tritici R3-111a-1]|uniref:SPX domain-containing protein n=1 Tax=Gaeumannomyces tritici (strain R3-111a-1) TaxID=644352 RepID=J3NG87_GAET3|nr:hypothetical protein GGTG_00280 [Gaeumannomyces tritici R3-111a-1]EJT80277.1 hypothetical protein GGTG_00280 [Gaeumannomyces tritici R3-111a-1]
MKYGEQFEQDSVPEWSLHNIDYNSLKHHIKAHTTKGQGVRAITIPGHQDAQLGKFEEDFYAELCRQHDRVGLFVTSKAEELSRRLQHLSNSIHNTLRLCARRKMSAKRQRRLMRYGQVALQCGDEIRDLLRFIGAQATAFGKILKKYRKWTGSQSLGVRFKENVLSDSKGFTNRDFHQLETQYEDLINEIRAATPPDSGSVTPADRPTTPARRHSGQHQPEGIVVLPTHFGDHPQQHQQPTSYWNEYDNGSEAGDNDGGYVIYINPENEEIRIPGFSALAALLSIPVETAKAWIATRSSSERQPLLHTANDSNTQPLNHGLTISGSYGTVTPHSRDGGANTAGPSAAAGYSGDEEDLDLASDEDTEFPNGYDARFAALPSINDQRIARYRDRMLFRGTIGANAAALVLLGVAALLIVTGKHKLRAEVDAGVILGVMSSLGCACVALGMTLTREGPAGQGVSLVNALLVYASFTGICVLNGALLVLVVGNTGLQ